MPADHAADDDGTTDFRVVLALVAAGQAVAIIPGLAIDEVPSGVACHTERAAA